MDSAMECLGRRFFSLGSERGSHLSKKFSLTWTMSSTTNTSVTQAKTLIAANGNWKRILKRRAESLTTRRQCDRSDGHGEEGYRQNQPQHYPVDGEDRWVDQVSLLAITAGQQPWMAKLLEQRHLLVFRQGTAERSLLLFHSRENFVRQLADDIVLLLRWAAPTLPIAGSDQ